MYQQKTTDLSQVTIFFSSNFTNVRCNVQNQIIYFSGQELFFDDRIFLGITFLMYAHRMENQIILMLEKVTKHDNLF